MTALEVKEESAPQTQPTTPKSTDGKELKKATRLAKLALDFSRKRGKTVHTNTEKSPFVFRNQTGICISFSGKGVTKTSVKYGDEAQFEMTPFHHDDDQNTREMNDSRFTRYDGHFPTLDVVLNFEGSRASHARKHSFAEPIGNLLTDRVSRSLQRVFIWQQCDDSILSSHIDLVWSVELEENRKILTLSSATYINIHGCGPDIEVGARILESEGTINPIIFLGRTKCGSFCLPVWAESCFCKVAIFIRPVAINGSESIHEWSSSPVLELVETGSSDDQEVSYASRTGAIEVQNNWVTSVDTSGGVHCNLRDETSESLQQQVWLQCTYNEEAIENNSLDALLDNFQGGSCKTVTIWPSISIRNMLP